ncbi:uncharacterized protein LOC128176654 [Crassostrea angulata]|uniref:Uncharacterized protein CXorf65-like protein n=1 Tax=Magallana gigas TaxID=29159 RepID=K1RY19_MAGGI|nr:uncharacterized protein LOC105341303 isoform X1 [Crassostrea gigas]XP_052699100.1 uncharacterized protein LOC128176654 [Crassostrea angulata]
MFVTVKFGDEQSRLFNANCRNDVLLQHIKKRCDCHREDDVELSDEKGVVKHLREFPYDYGIDHLKERETLILLKVDGSSFGDENESTMGDRLTFIPLLTGMEGNQEFMELINPRPQSRQSRKGSGREDERRGKPKAAKPAPTSKRQSSKSGGKKS